MKCPHCASSDTVWKAKAGKWECNSCEERFEGDSPENHASVSGGHPMPSAKAAKPKRIFFSYGHDANRELVDRFKADLEKRGHQVWIDYKEIGTWDDWKGTITRGIHDAELAIAFLSIHSTRDPGVCRNEVAMALQHFGKVYPVLVEEVPQESIPVTIAHLQWPDLSRWREFRDQEDLDFERFHEEKFLEIVSRVEGEACRFASEAEVLRRALNPSGFEGRFARHLDGFTGREWVFDAFEHWLDHQSSSRVFWIKAGPGFGKTALAVQMANRHRAAIVGTWFCDHQSVELRDPLRALQTIAYQLALRWDDYRVRLLPRLGLYADSSPEQIEEARKELAKKSLQDLFSFLISEPMAGLIWREHKLVILVDALDEAAEADGTNPLAALISGRFLELPEWIGFVVTSRPDASVLGHLQGFRPFAIEAGDSRNTADLQAYGEDQIGPLLHDIDVAEQERIVRLLVEKSAGMMLYLRLVSEGLKEGTLAVEDLESLDAGLSGLHGRYHAGFEARFGKDFHDAVQPLLRLIMAAPGPMPLDLAAEVLEWDRELAVRTRARVGSYLVEDQGGLSLFHKTLGEWLGSESAALYFTDAYPAAKKLGTFLWDLFDEREKDAYDLTKPLRWEPFVRDWLPGLLEHTERRNDWVGIAELALWFREKVLWGEAELLHRRTLEGRENALGPEHPDTLSSVNRLGGDLLAKGDYEGAELLFRRALEGREKALGTEHLDTIKSLSNLGIIHQKGDREEAETIFHRCLESLEKALGPEHPSTLTGVNNYGSALNTKGNYATAELLHRRCLKGREKVLGPEHPDTLQSLSSLGNVLRKKGDNEEAEALFRLALKGREKVLGKKHPDTLISMKKLGNLLSKKGDYEEAEALYRRALEGFENTLGQDHHQTLKCLEELADLLWNKGCRDEPEILSRRAFVGWERAVGLEHSNALSSMKMLGDILDYKLNFDGAEALFRRAFEHTQKVLGFEHPYTLECLTKLALLLPRKGDYVGAEIICRLAIDCGKNMSSAEYSNALAEHLERLFSSDRLRNAALAILRTFHICSDDRYYVSYTLGRYECIYGYHEEAKHLIKEQLQQNPEKKKQALADADFAAIHDWISQI
jgi:tetratricopeptide (TPR) repeat protein